MQQQDATSAHAQHSSIRASASSALNRFRVSAAAYETHEVTEPGQPSDRDAEFVTAEQEGSHANPPVSNLQLLRLCRDLPEDTEATQTLRALFGEAKSEIMLGQVLMLAEELGLSPERALPALLQLAAKREVRIELSTPISASTYVLLGGRDALDFDSRVQVAA